MYEAFKHLLHLHSLEKFIKMSFILDEILSFSINKTNKNHTILKVREIFFFFEVYWKNEKNELFFFTDKNHYLRNNRDALTIQTKVFEDNIFCLQVLCLSVWVIINLLSIIKTVLIPCYSINNGQHTSSIICCKFCLYNDNLILLWVFFHSNDPSN